MYAGALTTFLILLRSGIEPLPTTTPASFATGIVIVATLTAKLVTNGGRSAWLVGVLALMVYALPVAAPNSVKGTLTATTVGGDNADASMCNRPPLGENGTDSAETVAVRMVVKVD
jgi:hypothetical protein